MLQALFELQWLDAVDIGIVALVLYMGITWLRRSHAALVALGIAMLAGLYTGSRALDLELTSMAFHGFFSASLIVLVVIFQEELRQGFEELAGWVLGRRDHVRPRLDTTQILAEALGNLAKRRFGALVVIPGLQSLRRHVAGGTELAGKLSVPLLESIFDPHTPGHDGAAIVENRLVSHFGVQLPLSKNVAHRSDLGTRHSAALGLSELTDALCLIASEERGTLSVASGGTLRQVGSPNELALLLERFFRKSLPLEQRRGWWSRLFTENRGAKGVAAALAGALWLIFVPGSRPVELTVSVPVEIQHVPDGFDLVSVEPSRVEATLGGPRRDLLFLDTAALAVRVDASLAGQGRRTFELSDADLSGRRGVAVQGLRPQAVKISLEKAQKGS
jgi:uncharacterized protein (TIGR00159 family)